MENNNRNRYMSQYNKKDLEAFYFRKLNGYYEESIKQIGKNGEYKPQLKSNRENVRTTN